ncbi:ATP-binding protein [Chryseobacterium sp. CBo1]
MGLGLYICSQIIEKHKGEIGAESVLNEGSTFWFKIPISETII